MKKYKNDNFFGLLCIIGGVTLSLYGLSYFLLPFSLIIGGLLLINQGLHMKNMPSLLVFAKHWFFKFR